ncbi:MAG: hypothetical protein EA356_13065 [Geminicoccaceae bacterium]|nr:MAG: hypothetical protein EA356_13065 [Geminicoccaceae bacterium]
MHKRSSHWAIPIIAVLFTSGVVMAAATTAFADGLPPIPDLFGPGELAVPPSPELEESRRFRETAEAEFQAALPALVRQLQAVLDQADAGAAARVRIAGGSGMVMESRIGEGVVLLGAAGNAEAVIEDAILEIRALCAGGIRLHQRNGVEIDGTLVVHLALACDDGGWSEVVALGTAEGSGIVLHLPRQQQDAATERFAERVASTLVARLSGLAN